MIVVTPLIRSKAILNAAKGQPCTLRFHGICNSNPETTVAAHIRDQHKGMGIKASDYSVVFACSNCHRYLDEFDGKIGKLFPYADVVRGLQETWGLLIAAGIITVPVDKPRERRVKARKPKAERIPIQSKTGWPAGRKIQSRRFQRKSEA